MFRDQHASALTVQEADGSTVTTPTGDFDEDEEPYDYGVEGVDVDASADWVGGGDVKWIIRTAEVCSFILEV